MASPGVESNPPRSWVKKRKRQTLEGKGIYPQPAMSLDLKWTIIIPPVLLGTSSQPSELAWTQTGHISGIILVLVPSLPLSTEETLFPFDQIKPFYFSQEGQGFCHGAGNGELGWGAMGKGRLQSTGAEGPSFLPTFFLLPTCVTWPGGYLALVSLSLSFVEGSW